ncbi:hypothetical protein [Asaia bogorensis]|uniref:Uncharacterized protein n=1 Tax=Asaia bogorensis NBRC 16594 TaxID=1231624 RepID=A0AAN4U2L8_9PROT|nr:hypothetical protein [Asaia bogorensis]BAT19210.1 hypothetical protein Asbog_00916 [Asaia bogorensis NBRC 16594]GBQ72830.1 hypothetical protein AA0311_0033 [Asaia bogorensis NBRC 16594]GEL53562.1 hypothetical protein ABO01nite_15690 [Asaia bogorensis NBRC 16594]
MILSSAILLWIVAFAAHGFLQPKMCRILALPALPRVMLHPCRLLLPLLALYLCCKGGALYGVMMWFGTASVAGVLACLILTAISLRQTDGKGLTNQPAAIL